MDDAAYQRLLQQAKTQNAGSIRPQTTTYTQPQPQPQPQPTQPVQENRYGLTGDIWNRISSGYDTLASTPGFIGNVTRGTKDVTGNVLGKLNRYFIEPTQKFVGGGTKALQESLQEKNPIVRSVKQTPLYWAPKAIANVMDPKGVKLGQGADISLGYLPNRPLVQPEDIKSSKAMDFLIGEGVFPQLASAFSNPNFAVNLAADIATPGIPLKKLAAPLFNYTKGSDRVRKTLDTARKFAIKRPELQRTVERVRPGTLFKEGEEVLQRAPLYKMIRQKALFTELKTLMGGLSDAEKSVVGQFMEGGIPSKATEGLKVIANKINAISDDIGRELLEQKIITPETFAQYQGQYLSHINNAVLDELAKTNRNAVQRFKEGITRMFSKELEVLDEAKVRTPGGFASDLSSPRFKKRTGALQDYSRKADVVAQLGLGSELGAIEQAKAVGNVVGRYGVNLATGQPIMNPVKQAMNELLREGRKKASRIASLNRGQAGVTPIGKMASDLLDVFAKKQPAHIVTEVGEKYLKPGADVTGRIWGDTNTLSKTSRLTYLFEDLAKRKADVVEGLRELVTKATTREEAIDIVREYTEHFINKANPRDLKSLRAELSRSILTTVGGSSKDFKEDYKVIIAALKDPEIGPVVETMMSNIAKIDDKLGVLPKVSELKREKYLAAFTQDIIEHAKSKAQTGVVAKVASGLPQKAPKTLSVPLGKPLSLEAPKGYVKMQEVAGMPEFLARKYKDIAIPVSLADKIVERYTPQTRNIADRLVDTWKQFKTTLSGTPAYFMRNQKSNIYQASIETGKNVGQAGADNLTSMAELIGVRKGDPKLLEEFMNVADGRGNISLAKELLTGKKPSLLDPRNFQKLQENAAKYDIYKFYRNKGLDVLDSWERADKAIFSPYRVSKFERGYAKYLIPFYQWQRQEIPFFFRTYAENPERYAVYTKFKEGVERLSPEPRVEPPDYMKSQIRLPAKDIYGDQLYLDETYSLPFGSMVKLTGESEFPFGFNANPLFDLPTILQGKHPRYGSLLTKSLDEGEQRRAITKMILETYGPTAVREYLVNLPAAGKNQMEPYTNRRRTLGQFVTRMLGTKLSSFSPSKQMNLNQIEADILQKQQRSYEYKLADMYRTGEITREEYAKRLKESQAALNEKLTK